MNPSGGQANERLAVMQAFFLSVFRSISGSRIIHFLVLELSFSTKLCFLHLPVDQYFTMNSAQIKCLSVFALFAIIGFGPVPPGCLIGVYMVIMPPDWYLRLVDAVCYRHSFGAGSLQAFAFAIILSRPQWFYLHGRNVYG